MLSRFKTPVFIVVLLLAACPSAADADMRRAGERWRWVRFGSESGLPSEHVERVCETHSGDIWTQTSRGLAWFDGFRWYPVVVPGLAPSDERAFSFVEDSIGILVYRSGKVFHVDGAASYPVAFPFQGDTLAIRNARWMSDGNIFQGDSMLFRVSNGIVVPLPSPYDRPATRDGSPKYYENQLFSTQHSLLLKVDNELYRYDGGRWISILNSRTEYLRVHRVAENEVGHGVAVIQTEMARQDVYFWEPGGTPQRYPGERGDLIRSLDVSPDGETLMLLKTGKLRLHRNGRFEELPSFPSLVNYPLQVRFRANGDLWVCTEGGLFLCRLTSERWTTWETGDPGRPGMVNCIVRTRDGSFWFGTADGICVRSADGRNRYVKEIDGRPLGSITGMAEDRQGNIWIGSGSTLRGTYRWDGRSWRHFGLAEGLTAGGNTVPLIHKIVLTRSGQLWFCGVAAASPHEEEPGAFQYVGGRFHNVRRGDRVFAVVEDRAGALWFGTKKGLSRFHQGSWSHWRDSHHDGTDRGMLRNGEVFALAVDSTNRIWLGHRGSGLGCIDSTDSVKYYTIADGLVSNEVWDLQVDSSGHLWIGAHGGVGCFDGTRLMTFDVHSGLSNSLVWPVFVKNRRIYAGTEGSAVNILNPDWLNSKPPEIRFESPVLEDDKATFSWEANAYWADVPATRIETRYHLEGEAWSAWTTTRSVVFNGLASGTHRFHVQPRPTSWQDSARVYSVGFDIPPPLYLRPMVALPMTVLGLLVLTLAGAVWERKRRYDRTVRESEARFRALFKSNPIPTFTWKRADGNFLLIDLNDAAVAMSGGFLTPLIGRSIHETMTGLPGSIGMIEECYANQSIVRNELVHNGGQEELDTELAVTCSFVYPDMVLTHIEDVTERKHVEARIRESREQLRALASRLETVREEERSQLSREIHDELGQLMTGLKMDLAWIRKRVVECGEQVPEHMMGRIQQMNALLDDSIQTVRKIAGQLRPALLDELGLVAAMEWQAKEWQARTGIPCHADILTDDPQIPKEKAIELFRIFQELLTNVARHSGATEVTVVLNRVDYEVLLEVSDNGRGIRISEINRPVSLGILGMEERAARMGGSIVFRGEPGRGTTVHVTIPIQQVSP